MIELDTRGFEHPLPLEMAVKTFKTLSSSDVMRMIHTREPIPLFEIITKNGGFYRSRQINDVTWHIAITRDPNAQLEEYDV